MVDDEKSYCSICLSAIGSKNMAVLDNCQEHLFHFDCITQWIAHASVCPNCKTPCEVVHELTDVDVQARKKHVEFKVLEIDHDDDDGNFDYNQQQEEEEEENVDDVSFEQSDEDEEEKNEYTVKNLLSNFVVRDHDPIIYAGKNENEMDELDRIEKHIYATLKPKKAKRQKKSTTTKTRKK